MGLSFVQIINHLDRYMKEPGANEELLALLLVSHSSVEHTSIHKHTREETMSDSFRFKRDSREIY